MNHTLLKAVRYPMRAGILAIAVSLLGAGPVLAAERGDRSADAKERRHSPTQPLQSRGDVERRDIERRNRERAQRRGSALADLEVRSIDGSDNNLDNPEWGRADTAFVRLSHADYSDGTGAPSGDRRPNPREISNAVVAQPGSILNESGASDFVWLWGQFLDHDIDLTPTVSPVESFDITIPVGDPFFDPEGTGEQTMPLDRSLYVHVDGLRQQINMITAYIDASNVYGSDPEFAAGLRTLDGTGRLKTSAGDLLPFDPASPSSFMAGDSRVNEHVALAAIHTLFVREHNHWADRFRRENRRLDDEQIYQMARAVVAAEMQVITYREFLPLLLGPDALARYGGYRPDVNPGIANEFATASFRFGHTMVSPQLLRLDRSNDQIAAGHLPLRNAFFRPDEVVSHGIDSLLRGLAAQPAQRIDVHIIDDLRNFLFGAPGAGGFDLASLNIQRGRDHGLPPYNEVRRRLGLEAAVDFADVSSDPDIQARLASVYASVEDIDLWVGGLAEDPVPGALVGETVRTVLADQFERLRDGDSFWYEIHLPQDLIAEVEKQTLATIIRRNTGIGREIRDNVFVIADAVGKRSRDTRQGKNGGNDRSSDSRRQGRR